MSVSAIEHVLVLSDDIDGTRDFYCDAIGLEVGDRPPLAFPGYWLYADAGTSACIHIAERRRYATHASGLGLKVPERDPGADSGSGPIDHIAFTAGDYDELIVRLQQSGVPVVTNDVPGGIRQVFIEDPNGVRVEINVKD
jgi:catechol 2,3-dioxygenase-like lactoylglutathione lyase family enzyme